LRLSAKIHAQGLRAAEPLDFAFLEDAQEFGLEFQRNVTHFVQENGSFVSQFKTADGASDGAGECALLVAEKFVFEESGRNGSAIGETNGRSRRGLSL